MLLRKGIMNNKDPSTIYSPVDIEKFFQGCEIKPGEGQAAAQKISPIAAAHRIFTNSISIMPWMIRQRIKDERKEIDHNLSYVLKVRANEYMTPYIADKIMLSNAFWHGVGFAYPRRDNNGNVIEIIPLPSRGLRRYFDRDSGVAWYSFSVETDDPYNRTLTRKFEETELLVHFFETYDGRTGKGLLDIARDTIAQDSTAQKYGLRFYRNAARPSGIIQADGEIDDEARKMVRSDFEEMTSGLDNAFRVAVLDLGMKYTPLGLNQRDAQYVETRAFTVQEVCRFTGIPEYMLQTGKQSYQSNEQQQLDFLENTLMPHIVQQEQERTYKLFLPDEVRDGMYLKRNTAAILRGDNKSRATFYEKMIGMGVFCQDDALAFEDMSPLPDGLGKIHWMSKNYDTIENMRKGGK